MNIVQIKLSTSTVEKLFRLKLKSTASWIVSNRPICKHLHIIEKCILASKSIYFKQNSGICQLTKSNKSEINKYECVGSAELEYRVKNEESELKVLRINLSMTQLFKNAAENFRRLKIFHSINKGFLFPWEWIH